jgi:hypothetical protein
MRQAWLYLLCAGTCSCATVPSRVAVRPSPTAADSACAAVVAQMRADPTPSVYPASPDSIIVPPPDRPSSVRRHTYTLSLLVDVDGRVVPDSLRIEPSLGDSGFERAFRARLKRLTFTPALYRGCPVPSRFEIRMTL